MAEQKKTYQLKHEDTSFYDDETGLEVTRAEQVKIGEGAGKKTKLMIAKGGLIEVNSKAAEGKSSAGSGDEIAEDFPGHKALAEAGITTMTQLRAKSEEELDGIKGIGPKTLDDIKKALKS